MLPAERKQEILKYVQEKGAATIKDLSTHFDVHEATIRRDLSELEESKKLKRTHGGVIFNEKEVHSEPHFDMREGSFTEEKRKIGLKAASFIEEGDTVILDSGTTTAHIAEEIKSKKNITVITNDINIAALLRYSDLTVVVTGGVLFRENFILNGEVTNHTLSNLNAVKAFIATPALHHEKGLTHFDEALISAKISMVRAAREVFVVADHSKLSKVSLYTFAKMDEVDCIITDSKINKHIEQKMRDNCDRVIVV